MFKSFIKNEKGSIIVLVAISMTVLLGFSALAVDYGSMTNQRSLLQNAADAAALAGAIKGEDVAREYVMANTTGVAPEDIIITQPTPTSMTVSIRKDTQAFFSHLLTGSSTNEVAASATAEYTIQSPGAGYAIWAEDEVELKNKSVINGDVHSNTGTAPGNFDFKANVTINGNKTYYKESMPDYSVLQEDIDATYSGDLTLKNEGDKAALKRDYGIETGDTLYVPGTVNIHKNAGVIDFNIISDGNIKFNGSTQVVDTMFIYSKNGSIEFDGSNGALAMLLYAPKGTVTWNGQGTDLRGAIVAQNFIENGSEATITYDDAFASLFGKKISHLIE